MELIYSQYGAHLSGVKYHPIKVVETYGYFVTGVKFHPACDNVIIHVTKKKFQVLEPLPDFITLA